MTLFHFKKFAITLGGKGQHVQFCCDGTIWINHHIADITDTLHWNDEITFIIKP